MLRYVESVMVSPLQRLVVRLISPPEASLASFADYLLYILSSCFMLVNVGKLFQFFVFSTSDGLKNPFRRVVVQYSLFKSFPWLPCLLSY